MQAVNFGGQHRRQEKLIAGLLTFVGPQKRPRPEIRDLGECVVYERGERVNDNQRRVLRQACGYRLAEQCNKVRDGRTREMNKVAHSMRPYLALDI